MWVCKKCQEKLEDSFDNCWSCGANKEGKVEDDFVKSKKSTPTRLEVSKDNNQNVTVTDIKMPFGSMVEFMVKWAIASIPAFIILILIGFLVAGILGIGAVSLFK